MVIAFRYKCAMLFGIQLFCTAFKSAMMRQHAGTCLLGSGEFPTEINRCSALCLGEFKSSPGARVHIIFRILLTPFRVFVRLCKHFLGRECYIHPVVNFFTLTFFQRIFEGLNTKNEHFSRFIFSLKLACA